MAILCPIVPEKQEYKKTASKFWGGLNNLVKTTLGINEKSGDMLTWSTAMGPQILAAYQQAKGAIQSGLTKEGVGDVDNAVHILEGLKKIYMDQIEYTDLGRSGTYFLDIVNGIDKKISILRDGEPSRDIDAKKFIGDMQDGTTLDNPITLYTTLVFDKAKNMYADVVSGSSRIWDEVFGQPITVIPVKTKEKILYTLSSGNSIIRSGREWNLGLWGSFRRAMDKFSTISGVVAFSRHLWPLALLTAGLPAVVGAYGVMFAPTIFRGYNLLKRTVFASRKEAKDFIKKYGFIDRHKGGFRNRLAKTGYGMINGVGIDNIMMDSFYMREAAVTIADREGKSIQQLDADMQNNVEYKNIIYNAIYQVYMGYSGQEVYKKGETSLTALGRLTSVMSKFGMTNLKYGLRQMFFGKLPAQKAYANALENGDMNAQQSYTNYLNNSLDSVFFYQELFRGLSWAFRLARLADDLDDDDDDAEDNFLNTLVNLPDVLENSATFMAMAMSNTRLRLVYEGLKTVLKNQGFLLDEGEMFADQTAINVGVDPDALRTGKYVKSLLDQLFFRAAQPFVTAAQVHNAYKSSGNKQKALETLIGSYFGAMASFVNETDWVSEDLSMSTPLGHKGILYYITGEKFDRSYDIVQANNAGKEGQPLAGNKGFMAALLYGLEKSKIFQASDYWDIDAPTDIKSFINAAENSPKIMEAVAKGDLTGLSQEGRLYAFNQFTKLSESMLRKGLLYSDGELTHMYRDNKTGEYRFSDEGKKMIAIHDYLKSKLSKEEMQAMDKAFASARGSSDDQSKRANKTYITDLMIQTIAKEKGAVNSATLYAAFLSTALDAAYRKEGYVYSNGNINYNSIPKEVEKRLKSQLMSDYGHVARQIDADSFTSAIVYEVGLDNPNLRKSIKGDFAPTGDTLSKAELNYDKYDAMFDSFVLGVNDAQNGGLSGMGYLSNMSARYFDLLAKYPKQKDEVQKGMIENILTMKKYYEDAGLSDKAIVNATVPFFANNQDVLDDYLKSDKISKADKDAVMGELYDIYDKTDLVSQLPNIIKGIDESSGKTSGYYKTRGGRSYMSDITNDLPFRNAYMKFQNRYEKNLSYADDNYAKKIYSRQKAQYNTQERKYLNARAYFKGAVSRYPVDERFYPTSSGFQTYVKKQSKYKYQLPEGMRLFPSRFKQGTGVAIGKARETILKKSKLYNTSAPKFAKGGR